MFARLLLFAALLLIAPQAKADWIVSPGGAGAGYGSGTYSGGYNNNGGAYHNHNGYNGGTGYENVVVFHDVYDDPAEYVYHTAGEPAAYRGEAYQNYRGYTNLGGYSNSSGYYNYGGGYRGGYSY